MSAVDTLLHAIGAGYGWTVYPHRGLGEPVLPSLFYTTRRDSTQLIGGRLATVTAEATLLAATPEGVDAMQDDFAAAVARNGGRVVAVHDMDNAGVAFWRRGVDAEFPG